MCTTPISAADQRRTSKSAISRGRTLTINQDDIDPSCHSSAPFSKQRSPTMATQFKYTGDPNSHDTSSFSNGMSATCLCGSIKVTINDNELFTKKRGHLCHCANCRKVAGSYVASNLAIEKEKVEVDDPKGALKKYRDYATASGKCVERCFCGNCGKYVGRISSHRLTRSCGIVLYDSIKLC